MYTLYHICGTISSVFFNNYLFFSKKKATNLEFI
nr:MAG TPA: hypothetical protein [Caudoviricetes sp.]